MPLDFRKFDDEVDMGRDDMRGSEGKQRGVSLGLGEESLS